MIEDMRMRKLETKTQQAYIRAVRKLTAYLKRSPDTATVEDLRKFQLHLVDTGTSPITLNATASRYGTLPRRPTGISRGGDGRAAGVSALTLPFGLRARHAGGDRRGAKDSQTPCSLIERVTRCAVAALGVCVAADGKKSASDA